MDPSRRSAWLVPVVLPLPPGPSHARRGRATDRPLEAIRRHIAQLRRACEPGDCCAGRVSARLCCIGHMTAVRFRYCATAVPKNVRYAACEGKSCRSAHGPEAGVWRSWHARPLCALFRPGSGSGRILKADMQKESTFTVDRIHPTIFAVLEIVATLHGCRQGYICA